MHGKWKTIGVFRPKIRISIHYFQPVIGHSNVHEKDYKSHSKTTNRIQRLQIALALRAHAILLSLKNLLVLITTKLQEKS